MGNFLGHVTALTPRACVTLSGQLLGGPSTQAAPTREAQCSPVCEKLQMERRALHSRAPFASKQVLPGCQLAGACHDPPPASWDLLRQRRAGKCFLLTTKGSGLLMLFFKVETPALHPPHQHRPHCRTPGGREGTKPGQAEAQGPDATGPTQTSLPGQPMT